MSAATAQSVLAEVEHRLRQAGDGYAYRAGMARQIADAAQPRFLTKEEEISFRKDWDARVVPSPGTGGIRHPSNVVSIIGTRPRPV